MQLDPVRIAGQIPVIHAMVKASLNRQSQGTIGDRDVQKIVVVTQSHNLAQNLAHTMTKVTIKLEWLTANKIWQKANEQFSNPKYFLSL